MGIGLTIVKDDKYHHGQNGFMDLHALRYVLGSKNGNTRWNSGAKEYPYLTYEGAFNHYGSWKVSDKYSNGTRYMQPDQIKKWFKDLKKSSKEGNTLNVWHYPSKIAGFKKGYGKSFKHRIMIPEERLRISQNILKLIALLKHAIELNSEIRMF